MKLPKFFETIFQNSVRGEPTNEPLILRREICRQVGEKIVAQGNEQRIFPFNRINVEVFAPDDEQAVILAAGLCEGQTLSSEIRQFLQQDGCRFDRDLQVEIKILRERPSDWKRKTFQVKFERKSKSEDVAARLVVLIGKAEQKTYSLKKDRIYLGRMHEVVDENGLHIRYNDVVFLDVESDKINASVSREHAAIEYDEKSGVFILRDTHSHLGTHILRDNNKKKVDGMAGRILETKDIICLGKAKIRFFDEKAVN